MVWLNMITESSIGSSCWQKLLFSFHEITSRKFQKRTKPIIQQMHLEKVKCSESGLLLREIMKCLLMTADVRTCNPQLHPDIYRLLQVTRKRSLYINATFLGVNLRPWSTQSLKHRWIQNIQSTLLQKALHVFI